MKLKKIITMGLAAIMAVSAMSIPTFADDNGNDIVYSYVDTNNNEVNITQAELDAEHWDKDALGNTAPFIYDDFPMLINSFVDDYSNLSLQLTYLRNLSMAENASLAITDLTEDVVIYSEDIEQHTISVPGIEMNKTYMLTISETFDGATTEYNKAVVTSIQNADMPEYVQAADTNDDTIILIGDVDNLRASTFVDENGEVEINTDMPRYEQVKACDFSEYINNLKIDKLYRIYTRDSNNGRYFGFISTRGDIDGIFMPSITIYKWDTYINMTKNVEMPSSTVKRLNLNNVSSINATSISPKLTSSQILNGITTEINSYRDYAFNWSSSYRDFEVFKFKVPEDSEDEPFDIAIHANDSITMEIWSQQPGASSLTYEMIDWNRNGNIGWHTLMEFAHGAIAEGGYVYFALYFNGTVSSGEGTISIQMSNTNDDVTGSAYQAYQDYLNGSYTQYTSYTPFYITDDRDVDTFFLDCGTSSVKNYIRLKGVGEADKGNYNNKFSQNNKSIELAYTPANASILRTSCPPDDIMTLAAGNSSLRFTTTSTTANKKFLYIYNESGNNNKKNDIYLLRRYNN